MNDLTNSGSFCRRMAEAEHKPECPSLVGQPWPPRWGWTAATCEGCNTAADPELFDRLAAEVHQHMAPQPDLFGDESAEPLSTTDSPPAAPASSDCKWPPTVTFRPQ